MSRSKRWRGAAALFLSAGLFAAGSQEVHASGGGSARPNGACLPVLDACGGSTTTTTQPAGGGGPRAVPAPIYGVTVDSVSNLPEIVAGATALSHQPTTRVYFDVNDATGQTYSTALEDLYPHSYVMGELLDSSDMPRAERQDLTKPTWEHDRVAAYLSNLQTYVDIWEIGNEVNGNWTCLGGASTPCTASGYRTGANLIVDAYDQVSSLGRPTALTLWYNGNGPNDPNGCPGTGEPDPLTYSSTYLPASVRDGLDYVLISYYQTQCNDYALTNADVTSFMQKLHALYPNAKLGFGEVGLPNAVSSASDRQTAISFIDHYYGLDTGLPYYVGGYFWWYYAEDALPYSGNSVWEAIDTAFGSET